MTDGMLARVWRAIWNPPPPRSVQRAARAQEEATSRLVRKIENETASRRLSISIDRDLTRERGNGHAR